MNRLSSNALLPDAEYTTERRNKPLCACIDTALKLYFMDLDGEQPKELYEMVLQEMEQPLLKHVMEYTKGNQSRAAIVLGLNRATLRKKLEKYDLNN